MGDGFKTRDVFPTIQYIPTSPLFPQHDAAVALLAKFKNQPSLRDHPKYFTHNCAANVRFVLSVSRYDP